MGRPLPWPTGASEALSDLLLRRDCRTGPAPDSGSARNRACARCFWRGVYRRGGSGRVSGGHVLADVGFEDGGHRDAVGGGADLELAVEVGGQEEVDAGAGHIVFR